MPEFLIETVETIDSTNDQLTREVDAGKLSIDKILIARHQTNGHGSKDRSFISAANCGIYFTYLHFYKDEKELAYITQKTAVAVYKTFYDIFGIDLSIKWINDLCYKDKKVCGILCRNLIKHKAVIIGIGIDLFKNENLDESIKDIAGYIFKDKTELIDVMNSNEKLPKDCCVYHNLYESFKSLKIEGIELNDKDLWDPEAFVVQIVTRINVLIKKEGLPQLYIDKNIIKDKKIYEDCNLEC